MKVGECFEPTDICFCSTRSLTENSVLGDYSGDWIAVLIPVPKWSYAKNLRANSRSSIGRNSSFIMNTSWALVYDPNDSRKSNCFLQCRAISFALVPRLVCVRRAKKL